MRILQILPLVSAEGAFGGPTSVALSQSQELIKRGHSVTIVAAYEGVGEMPKSIEGTPAKLWRARHLLPKSGFSGLVSFAAWRWLYGEIDSRSFDIAHIHSGRHLMTLQMGRLLRKSGIAYVVQTHGMLPPNHGLSARVLDRVATLPMLEQARHVLTLTNAEESALQSQFPSGIAYFRLENGVAHLPLVPRQTASVAELLFVGRLQLRKQPELLVEAAALIRRRNVKVRLAFVGPDEGMLAKLLKIIKELELEDCSTIEGPLAHAHILQRMRRASILILPSVDEPFPVSLLEAMSVGTVVVCTTSCGLASLLVEYGAGGVVEPNAEALANEIQRLLSDETLMQSMRMGAYRLLEDRLSVHAVVNRLETVYEDALSA